MTQLTECTWPTWAREQLLDAVALASVVRPGRLLATELYEGWFAAPVQRRGAPRRALVGEYRRAHSATASSLIDGVPVLERADGIGRDGWWRTWNTSWHPRQDATRLLLSPRPESVSALVTLLTARLRDVAYLLCCPTAANRLTRTGAVVLYVARMTVLTPDLVDALAPLLRAETPPLCLPVAPGLALAQYPDNGMTFGEHRCHLVALALAAARPGEELNAIADVFLAHGVDPAAPYRAG